MAIDRARKGISARLARMAGLVAILVVSAIHLPAQDTIEARLAALESRVRQLEGELAVARGITGGSFIGVKATESEMAGAMIRPAVYTTTESVEMALAAPPQQTDFTDDFEGLNFFKGVTFSGFVDSYYEYNFNKPPSRITTLRNFDFDHSTFRLNLAELNMTKAATEASPFGYNLSYGVGPAIDVVNGGEKGTTADTFLQYYMSARIPTSRGITLDFGKFVTTAGAEVIETHPNFNYSRGFLFGLAIPFYHFGLRATMPATDTLTFTAFLANGWDNVLDSGDGKTLGLTLNWAPGKFGFIQNYITGPETPGEDDPFRHLFDTVITIKPIEQVTFVTNFDYGMDKLDGAHQHWIGTANYLRLQPSPMFALTPRFEYFVDSTGFRTGTIQTLKSFTITPEFLAGDHFITRFEFRRDWSNEEVFEVEDPTSDDPTAQNTFGVGLILKF